MKLFQKLTNLLSKCKLMLIKFLLNGKEINLTSDNVIIKSNNFNVDKDGNMKCTSGTMQDVNIQEGTINLKSSNKYASTKLLTVEDSDGNLFGANATRVWLNRGSGESAIYMQGGNLSQAAISLTDQDGSNTVIYGSLISTPRLTQTSLEEIKKNIEKYSKALEIVKNADIYIYNLKTEEDTDKKHIGFVIGEKYNTPDEVIAKEGNGIEMYSMASVLWQAVKELTEKVESLENKLKEEDNGKDNI